MDTAKKSNSPGRPAGRNKNTTVTFRMSEEEAELLAETAQKLGKSKTEVVLHGIQQQAEQAAEITQSNTDSNK